MASKCFNPHHATAIEAHTHESFPIAQACRFSGDTPIKSIEERDFDEFIDAQPVVFHD